MCLFSFKSQVASSSVGAFSPEAGELDIHDQYIQSRNGSQRELQDEESSRFSSVQEVPTSSRDTVTSRKQYLHSNASVEVPRATFWRMQTRLPRLSGPFCLPEPCRTKSLDNGNGLHGSPDSDLDIQPPPDLPQVQEACLLDRGGCLRGSPCSHLEVSADLL
ncbi:uncharacterized protein LOC115310262 [Ixodes scapularis]|uniref:uncharacterized protein LOC115310262 n=1 Tax=Ixodes scapularis TaxID=6945 RepID=UPI001A9FCC17|nr:uncharacterized protein LOC115310262 [Ixodes scapularis]